MLGAVKGKRLTFGFPVSFYGDQQGDYIALNSVIYLHYVHVHAIKT